MQVLFPRPILEPRLFHCRQLPSGRLRAKEINQFEQEVTDIYIFKKIFMGNYFFRTWSMTT